MSKKFKKVEKTNVVDSLPEKVVSNPKPFSPLILRVGRTCRFDKKKDYQKVESGLAISLSESLRTGVVKESDVTLETNGIDDPETIVGTVRNRFDAIEAERAIRKYGKKAKPVTTPSAPSGVTPPSE